MAHSMWAAAAPKPREAPVMITVLSVMFDLIQERR
jgi:hypothetical protein